jgi:hypothetical protein
VYLANVIDLDDETGLELEGNECVVKVCCDRTIFCSVSGLSIAWTPWLYTLYFLAYFGDIFFFRFSA